MSHSWRFRATRAPSSGRQDIFLGEQNRLRALHFRSADCVGPRRGRGASPRFFTLSGRLLHTPHAPLFSPNPHTCFRGPCSLACRRGAVVRALGGHAPGLPNWLRTSTKAFAPPPPAPPVCPQGHPRGKERTRTYPTNTSPWPCCRGRAPHAGHRRLRVARGPAQVDTRAVEEKKSWPWPGTAVVCLPATAPPNPPTTPIPPRRCPPAHGPLPTHTLTRPPLFSPSLFPMHSRP